MEELTKTLYEKIQKLEKNEQALIDSLHQDKKFYLEKLTSICQEWERQESVESDIEKRLTILESNVKRLNSNSSQISQQLTKLSEILQKKRVIQE